MIWKPCTLYDLQKTGTDQLGNDVVAPVEVKSTFARFTPWTDAQIALEGREVTENEQRFALPVPYQAVADCYMAEINGVKQEITAKINLCPRYTVIQVKVYKE